MVCYISQIGHEEASSLVCAQGGVPQLHISSFVRLVVLIYTLEASLSHIVLAASLVVMLA